MEVAVAAMPPGVDQWILILDAGGELLLPCTFIPMVSSRVPSEWSTEEFNKILFLFPEFTWITFQAHRLAFYLAFLMGIWHDFSVKEMHIVTFDDTNLNCCGPQVTPN